MTEIHALTHEDARWEELLQFAEGSAWSAGPFLARRMRDAVPEYARGLGFARVCVMSGEKGLYEKYGFRRPGEYPTAFGTVDQLFVKET